MCEFLFRGKRLDNGEWVHGDLAHHDDGRVFIRHWRCRTYASHEVDPDTVGPYIGLSDKNSVKIFSGDIICAKNDYEEMKFVVLFGICGGVQNVLHDVGYLTFYFSEIRRNPRNFPIRNDPLYFLNAYECEVIGNIHDNQELLEGGEG